MTKLRFFVLASFVALFSHDGAHAQTSLDAAQVTCKFSGTPLIIMAFQGATSAPITPGARLPFVCIPVDLKSFTLDTSTNPPTLRVISAAPAATYVDGEVPGGAIDGTNAAFTLAAVPAASSLKLYRNGIRLTQGSDYTLSGQAITFAAGAVPQPNDSLMADYRR